MQFDLTCIISNNSSKVKWNKNRIKTQGEENRGLSMNEDCSIKNQVFLIESQFQLQVDFSLFHFFNSQLDITFKCSPKLKNFKKLKIPSKFWMKIRNLMIYALLKFQIF